MEEATQATTEAPKTNDLSTPADDVAGIDEIDETAIRYMSGRFQSIERVEALATFTGKVKALAGELGENGDVEVSSGIGSPDGIVGDYPDFWVNLRFEQSAVYRVVDALNDALVDVHLLEHHDREVVGDEGPFRRSYVDLTLTPAIDTQATDQDVEQAVGGLDS